MSISKDSLQEYISEVKVVVLKTEKEIEAFRLKFLARKDGILTGIYNSFRLLSQNDKSVFGKLVNELKTEIENKINSSKNELQFEVSSKKQYDDLTLPGEGNPFGALHPLTQIGNRISEIFSRMDFVEEKGVEIEDDWHNFSALNFPENHPARDMQDTFFIENESEQKSLLRTHTSTVQVHLMENKTPPIRAIMPGRVYRNETISARSHCIFHQVEGLYIDKDVSFAELKQCIYYFVEEMFGVGTKVRFRPSFFPFTEPSAEADVSCFICNQKGCSVCKYSGWVEILGCGMVHPNVLENCNIDSTTYTGYAFGMGIERIAMLKYDIPDLRLFFENDFRFLSQFRY